MKRLVFVLGFFLVFLPFFGQTGDPIQSIGFVQNQTKIATTNNGEVTFGISGSPLYGAGIVTIPSGAESGSTADVRIQDGFSGFVGYFPQLLDQQVFASKGYFGDNVQLRWDVLNSLNSIDRFQIFRKPLADEGDSVQITSLASDIYSYQDITGDLGVLYKYTIFAKGVADDLRIEYYNYVETVGFSFPTGSLSGQIAFEGGNAVEGVSVLATTAGDLEGQAVQLDGLNDYLEIVHGSDDTELELNSGFSIQLWAKYESDKESPLFNKGDSYSLTYDGSNFNFTIDDAELDLAFENPVDSFFHVTASYNLELAEISLTIISDKVYEKSVSLDAKPLANRSDFLIGTDDLAYWKGYVDEIRLWNKALTSNEIINNYDRYISGNDADLSGYWRLDMGVTSSFYDFARAGTKFTENHGALRGGASFSPNTPLQSQLAFRGFTDEFGNYTITGFPYETAGSLYKFTPLLTHHEFEPSQQTRFVGPGTTIHNNVDFKDISAFDVSGTIRYFNGPMPVSGVNLLVDGRPVFDADGKLIETDTEGRFKIQVPIGLHTVRADLTNHTFVKEGRFPEPKEDDSIPLWNFQQPITDLSWVDSTLVKVVGRVVGGPVEQNKPLGFGRSVNNIGDTKIILRTKNQLDLTLSSSFQDKVDFETLGNRSQQISETNIDHEHINQIEFSGNKVTITPNPETGEFIAYLLPLEYEVFEITGGKLKAEDFGVIDLRNSFIEKSSVLVDTVAASVNGQNISDSRFNGKSPDLYEGSEELLRNDTLFTIAIDSFKYQSRVDFIYRKRPDIQVKNIKGEEVFGESSYVFSDASTTETIPFIGENGEYTFGFPIFKQDKNYFFKISLFEEYNDGKGNTDKVPVTDGKLEILNFLSYSSEKLTLELDKKGAVTYEFTAGLPNRSKETGANEENFDFTKVLNITAFSGNNGAIDTKFREEDPFRGVVLGAQAQGNNFVTGGPDILHFILRDPPGSASSTSIAKGTTTTNSLTVGGSTSVGTSNETKLAAGANIETSVGLGAALHKSVKIALSATGTADVSTTFSGSDASVTTVTLNETISTSNNSSLVGDAGDVFIGNATNLVYGAVSRLELVPVARCEDCGGKEYVGYKFGVKNALAVGSEFKTSFAFSQQYIETVLIPNLRNLRNNLLEYYENPESVTPQGESPIYISKLKLDDPKYGSSNTDEEIWGNEASEFPEFGPSYIIRYPENFEGEENDQVHYYNQQIENWIMNLRHNEEQKIKAELVENLSFEGGTSISKSRTSSKSITNTFQWDLTTSASIAKEVGFFVDGTGASSTTKVSFGVGTNVSDSNTESQETTVSYTLFDGDIGDAYTVDVKEADDGFGPVFTVRGGQTSCPWTPEARTKYYEPGNHILNVATVRREGPQLAVEQNLRTGIPSNRSALYTLLLSSDSETEENNTYNLTLNESSNPYGAILKINGTPLGNGLSFGVTHGETLKLTLTVEQGREDVDDYDNLELVLSSQCDGQINSGPVKISAKFVPGCSDVNISSPGNNWVLNTEREDPILPIRIDSYNRDYDNFSRIALQYRALGASSFTTQMIFYNNQTDFDAANEPKTLIVANTIDYGFDMSSLPDQVYDIRAVSYCDAGPGLIYETPSEEIRGTKDIQKPVLFGTPQPADGILGADDDIIIRFNEKINAGRLTLSNFSIRGVLNNTPVDNSVSLDLDGIDDYARIERGLNLSNRSFTIEFKVRRKAIGKEMILFSKGYQEDYLQIGINKDDQFFIDVAGEIITSSTKLIDLELFHHFALVYNQDNNSYNAILNDNYIFERRTPDKKYSGKGPVLIGKSLTQDNRFADLNFLDLRVWDQSKDLADVFASINDRYTGDEQGLLGYWLFDEGNGRLGLDKASFRNARVFSDWLVLPEGKSVSFDGNQSHLTINTAETVVIGNDTDFSIEFWYYGISDQTDVVMFSSGRGESTTAEEDNVDAPNKSLSIGFDESGKLYLVSKGVVNQIPLESQEVLNNQWHHFAFSVKRNGSANVFLDGEQVLAFNPDDVGGLIRSKMTIGARGYNVGVTEITYDKHFQGLIDEFRFWKFGLNQTQVNINRFSHLQGDEFGLLAYYPFEDYRTNAGTLVLENSLGDQNENPFGLNGGFAESFGSVEFSMNTPNIKIARPIQKVPFTWVVNDDELLIELDESLATILEGSLIEISLDEVQDLYDNRIESPISFTALIDLNKVKWTDRQVANELFVDEGFEFNVPILNKGGTEESFEIFNIPAWLSVEPRSGFISPQSSLDISFTIDRGINVGYYNEDIFLTTGFGFSEKLNLDLSIFETFPEWEVNKTDFEFSMSIVAQLNSQGIVSRDENDLIAVYIDNQLRGSASLSYVEELDQYMAFIDVYALSSEGQESLEFRAFDANTGIEYRSLEIDNPIRFEADKTFGRPTDPIELRTTTLVSETVLLESGYSWRSFNINSTSLDKTDDLLVNVDALTKDRVTFQDQVDVYTEDIGWTGQITNNGGYQIGNYYLFYLQNGGDLDLVGTRANIDTEIAIRKGFNRVGYIPDYNLNVNEAFSSLPPSDGDVVRGQFAFAIFEEGIGWIGSLNNLEPGEGYIYESKSEVDKTLKYPQVSFLSSAAPPESDVIVDYEYVSPWRFDQYPYPNNMALFADLDAENPEEYVIGAFKNGELVGIAKAEKQGDDTRYYMTIFGNVAPYDVSFVAFNRRTGKYSGISNKIDYRPFDLVASNEEPLILTLEEEINLNATSVAYPNPFSNQIQVKLSVPSYSLGYQIVDVSGNVIFQGRKIEEKRLRFFTWDATNAKGLEVSNGVYFIKLLMDGKAETIKVIKQK
ncbi:LamG-like jellyroll fold domain-containing protein [Roseivirga sp.]|uniref:LamG-like jellyroll fold domain-containing protein n=1 Tax=Roseivirga sp. TaxID=1964215 RepID=UPI003B8BFD5A